ncbi:MAG: MGMT family protein [Erysipelotrichaceae bacterium]|nr:MGMT family protein [Erysipelotrichaceae bacterium]
MLKDEVLNYLTTIPKGKVVTYSQIGKDLDTKAYRAIGNILHNNSDPVKYPCFKVVNAKGELAEHFGAEGGILTQRERLINDGVEVIDFRVDLNKYQWKKEKK